MNHIVKPFRPYFNTPLDPHRTQGMIAYYDASTQQGGGYLADKVGNKHGVFYNSPTWQNGNAVKTVRTLSQNVRINGLTLSYPCTVSMWVSFPEFVHNTVFLGMKMGGTSASLTIYDNQILTGVGTTGAVNISELSINKLYKIDCVHKSTSEGSVYINGADKTVSGISAYNQIPSNVITIGANYIESYYRYSSVNFQQLAIFNRALTRGEIINHYQDPYYFYERPKIYGFIASSGRNSLPAIINNYRQQGVM